jgi:hypothetical protein
MSNDGENISLLEKWEIDLKNIRILKIKWKLNYENSQER